MGLTPNFFDHVFAHDNGGGRAVGGLGGIAGRHRPAGGKHRPQLGQAFEGGRLADPVVEILKKRLFLVGPVGLRHETVAGVGTISE